MVEIIFLTSSSIKLAHARFLCRNYTVRISKQRHYGVTYEEPRGPDREAILEASVRDAYARLKKSLSSAEEKFAIIEDTSVIIDALSTEKEFPGVDVKYWMQENTFAMLNKELKKHGNNRRSSVRSDIVLMLPRALRLLT